MILQVGGETTWKMSGRTQEILSWNAPPSLNSNKNATDIFMGFDC